MTRLIAIIKKEFIQMRRDRVTLVIMVLIPLLQTLIFGFAINTDVKHLPAVVFDQSLSKESREFLDALTATEYYDIRHVANSYREVTDLIQAGSVKAGVIIPPDYAANLKNRRGTSVQVVVDATDSMAASSAISTAQMVGQQKSQEITTQRLTAAGFNMDKQKTAIDVRIRPWYNPDFITAWYMVPAIGGMILTITMMILTTLAIIKERERGTLEQLIVTPLKTYELMLGKILPYVIIGYMQLTILLLTAAFVFEIPFSGSIPLLYFLTGFFIVASLGLGLAVSNVAKTQMQGVLMSFSLIMPSMLLSGFMFPREAMPKFFYYTGYFIPITYYLEIIRGIILKGNTMAYLWTQVVALCVFIAVVLTISVARFKKRLE